MPATGHNTLERKNSVSSTGQKALTCVEHPAGNTQALRVTFASSIYSSNILELIFFQMKTSWKKISLNSISIPREVVQEVRQLIQVITADPDLEQKHPSGGMTLRRSCHPGCSGSTAGLSAAVQHHLRARCKYCS